MTKSSAFFFSAASILAASFAATTMASDISVGLELKEGAGAWQPVGPGLSTIAASEGAYRATIVPTGGSDTSYTFPVSFAFPASGGEVLVSLQSSVDLSLWSDDTTGTQTLVGSKFFRVGSEAVLVNVPGGTLDDLTVSTFLMGKYEVTYAEWQKVHAWALDNDYVFDNPGTGCADDHPVMFVNWYDIVKWCNAKSEMEGLTPVYTLDGLTYRTGNSSPRPDWNASADGYRLPTLDEWQYAARGGASSLGYIYAGGDDIAAVAWYDGNSSGAACEPSYSTWPVGLKTPNELLIHDMNGNVWEWTWTPVSEGSAFRYYTGGGWGSLIEEFDLSSATWNNASLENNNFGFRLARNAPAL